MKTIPYPSEENDYLAGHVQLLRDSLRALTGRDLAEGGVSPEEAAKQIFNAPFVVLSHNPDPDPILTYANRIGLELFELTWAKLVTTASRYTAEAPNRRERKRLLDRVTSEGFIDDYAGVRISAKGRRFQIDRATVWNLKDEEDRFLGQAAMFRTWTFL